MKGKENDVEFRLWQQKVDDHMAEYQRDKEEGAATMNRVLKLTEENATHVKDLIESTKGVVGVYKDLSGAIKVAAAFGNFLKWVSGLAVIGVAINWAVGFFGY